jgi:hypothetical protein
LFPAPKNDDGLLSPYGGERHSGTGIKAFREEEKGFADQEDFNVSLDFYKWEMKTHMSLSVKKFRKGFPNVRLDPFDIKLFFGRGEGVNQGTSDPSIRITQKQTNGNNSENRATFYSPGKKKKKRDQ